MCPWVLRKGLAHDRPPVLVTQLHIARQVGCERVTTGQRAVVDGLTGSSRRQRRRRRRRQAAAAGSSGGGRAVTCSRLRWSMKTVVQAPFPTCTTWPHGERTVRTLCRNGAALRKETLLHRRFLFGNSVCHRDEHGPAALPPARAFSAQCGWLEVDRATAAQCG